MEPHPGKADDLTAIGAVLAGSPANALDGASVAVFCLVDDDAVVSVVGQAVDSADLGGLTLVNLPPTVRPAPATWLTNWVRGASRWWTARS